VKPAEAHTQFDAWQISYPDDPLWRRNQRQRDCALWIASLSTNGGSYIAGIEARAAQGKPVKHVAPVASFFINIIDALVDPLLEKLSPQQVRLTELASEKIQTILTLAPGNGAPIGGLKVIAESGWFAARSSGTEDIYKIYAESFGGADHLCRILEEAQVIVNDALAAAPQKPEIPSKTDLKENL
jgi:phosphomannomutase